MMMLDLDETAQAWKLLHCTDMRQLWQSWRTKKEHLVGLRQTHQDSLLAGDRFDPNQGPAGLWKVTSWMELVRLVGALQHANQDSTLWYRGQGVYVDKEDPNPRPIPQLVPSRYRKSIAVPKVEEVGDWLNIVAKKADLLRRLKPLARLALLQHYGIPTSFLDVTKSLSVAASFAAWNASGGGHSPNSVEAWQSRLDKRIVILATPRSTTAFSDFTRANVVTVDLMAQMPSYCLRPHMQWAGFVALRSSAVRDLQFTSHYNPNENALDPLCIGSVRLDLSDEELSGFGVLHASKHFPKASAGCALCSQGEDMDGDYLLHVLGCVAKQNPPPHQLR